MNKQEFDQLFDNAFDESVKTHEFLPDSSTSWAKVKKALDKKTRRKRTLRILPYIAAAFIFGAVIFGTPTVTNAFQPFYQAITTIKDGVINIIFGTNAPNPTKPRTAPPPDYTGNLSYDPTSNSYAGNNDEDTKYNSKEFNTWEEASPFIDFNLPDNLNIPDNYKLKYVQTLINEKTQISSITTINYRKSDDVGYFITIQKLRPNSVLKSGADTSNNDVTLETVHIGDTPAYLFTTIDGTTSIEFLKIDTHVSIIGALSKEDAILIAEDLTTGKY
ncbi:DUF4367 domain-containing protein [Paenibacillus sp. L3-i20]|uniref:DUF4367 domain-containing protein n=1 Tax=Paenibacillus sp. L3-i20 TaxID=2905833 RepID=UPI001EDE0460|nr:DUF4367 domain-containing protein [Paenibacillus sp. L3-i20]GKU76436.1 hypothetical protein L3i20_v208330 [Paenibacillus sp. L3-i20]